MPIDINISKIYSRVFSSLVFPILLLYERTSIV